MNDANTSRGTQQAGWGASIWDDPENNESAPKKCPHCDQALAHPDDIRENEDIEASGLFSAYREHRQAHFEWGDDPTEHGDTGRDPYLGSNYSNDRDALWEPDDGPSGDPEEVVGHVFTVDIRYEATCRGTVVAHDKQAAKEKLERLRLDDEADLNGNVPQANVTMELHKDAYSTKEVKRKDTDLAERMEGWPW